MSVATLTGYADTLLHNTAASIETCFDTPALSSVLGDDAHIELAGPSTLGLRL